jgi:protein-ribulosamine 3-kinase
MSSSTLWQDIAAAISQHSRQNFKPQTPQRVAGGSISQAIKLSDGKQNWFVKTNQASLLDMFAAEAAGLNALADTQTLQVPRALCSGISQGQSYIVLEYINFGRASNHSHAQAGEQLAAMHQHTAGHFGWQQTNTIGATRQPNHWQVNWADFWRDQRLGFQLELAAQNGYGGLLQKQGEKLLMHLPVLLNHQPQASLLHGDLWSGNLGFNQMGEPVIFDPAVYYGDREADLAMTELFGGFSPDFYAAYRNTWPLDVGYPVRKRLYNLYHILNHANLFGGGYANQAQNMIDQLLAEC